MDDEFDVIVIGGGPAGYPAAIKAAQLGRKTALIEAKQMGGTCLNRGCIPSKTLIANALLWNKIQHAEDYGINVGDISYDFSKMKKRKDKVVDKVRDGLQSLIDSNAITLYRGYGKLISSTEVKVNGRDNAVLKTKAIIVATGSEPRKIEAFPFDYDLIHDSTSILEMTELPKSIAIVGGGVIGCEFASLYNAFGVNVTILEMMPSIIPMECPSVVKALTKSFQKKGINISCNVKVQSIDKTTKGVSVNIAGDEAVSADIALVCVGRQLNTRGIGLENVGVMINSNGIIDVNEKMETSVPGIYAAGDIASRWWLAHVASHQGIVAARNACGQHASMHYNAVPSVIFTDPEIGTVGKTLTEAIEEGYNATLGTFPFQALGKSQATLETEGFGQIVIDKDTGQVIGAQVVGHEAATLVAEMAIVIANEMTIDCVTETIHAHPTVAEVWLEAALLANETPLHLPPKKQKTKSVLKTTAS